MAQALRKQITSAACGNPCGERILSPALLELNLTAEEIFQAAFA